jgi:hypothetical protein
MGKVFLSHSSAQKPLVENIANKIGRENCIYDKYTFEAGLDTLEEIIDGLNETDLFVVFLSDEALNSDWVKAELAIGKKLKLLGSIKQFLPIIVDPTVSHKDARIPEWLKGMNLKEIDDPFLIKKKIDQSLRDILFDSNPQAKAREELFVGRNILMEEFETQYNAIGQQRPACFVGSGVEGIGRRTFMKKALIKVRSISASYDPIYIFLDSKESIEDFILKFKEVGSSAYDEMLQDLSSRSFEDKVAIAIQAIANLVNSNEKIFIVDSGCIIHSNKHIAEWFVSIISSGVFNNALPLILISRFRPSPMFVTENSFIKSIHIDALSQKDIQKLFVQYSDYLGLMISENNANKIIDVLNGIPSQVFFALDLVKRTNIDYAIRNIMEVVEFGESKVFYLVDMLQRDSKKLDILVLISKVDFISYDFLYKIIGRTEENEKIIEEFFILGIFETFGGFSENIRVNYTMTDYIRRSKFKISNAYNQKLKAQLKLFLNNSDGKGDLSELLINVKGALLGGHKIDAKYYLPSFVVKTIEDMYNQQLYSKVILLADEMLQNAARMDYAMEREISYWLCLALARERMARFETEVKALDGADYDFLYGFYFRRKKMYDKALNHIQRALAERPHFPRAKRELVNIYLNQGNYADALETARDNYNRHKANAFHIHAYFICLIRRKISKTADDINILRHLLDSIRKTNARKADDLYRTMQIEFDYYISKKNGKSAIVELKQLLKGSKTQYQAYQALYGVFVKEGEYEQAEVLKQQHAATEVEYDDVD